MIKPSKKWLALCLTTTMFAGTLCTYSTKAEQVYYSDENVSITSAIDRYIAVNGGMELSQMDEMSVATDELPAALSTPLDAEETTEETTEETGETTEETTEEAIEETEDDTQPSLTVAADYFDNKAIIVASSYVNIRESAGTDSSVVGTIDNNGLVTVEEKGSEWSLVSSGGVRGYIKNEFMKFGSDAATYASANLKQVVEINTASLRVRLSASENSDVLTNVSQGSKYEIISIGTEWTNIKVSDSISGFVKNDYIIISYNTVSAKAVEKPQTPSGSTTPVNPPATDVPYSELGVEVANYAVQFVGNPYVYGGTSLTEGADCSGFVMRVYADFGYSIPRTADVQATVGAEVALTAVQPGDLIFYDHGTGSIDHVALYIGNGQIVHASTSRTGIIIADMYYSTPCKATRIIY